MPIQDTYKTISSPTTAEFKDRGSKFIAYAFPTKDTTDIENALDQVKKEHPKARHHCYAYRLGLDGNNFRANDDGEPSGTAGRPILGQIDSFELTDVFIVVTRYFGGTLLGTSGLINAYKLSAQYALDASTVEEKIVEDIFKITFDYSIMSDIMNAVKKLNINIIEQHFEETAFLKIGIRRSHVQEQLIKLKASILKVSTEQVDKDTKISGLKINPID